MTDGIIQKIFNKWIDRTAPKTPPFDTLSMIEQELIEEIKNASENSVQMTPNGLKIIKIVRLSKLVIGDNLD